MCIDKLLHYNSFIPFFKPFGISPIILESDEEVSSSHLCEHSDGGLPLFCSKKDVPDCSQACEQLSSCVGYGFGQGSCVLFPSYRACPSGWYLIPGTIATTSSQLVSGSLISGYNCYRKTSMH